MIELEYDVLRQAVAADESKIPIAELPPGRLTEILVDYIATADTRRTGPVWLAAHLHLRGIICDQPGAIAAELAELARLGILVPIRGKPWWRLT